MKQEESTTLLSTSQYLEFQEVTLNSKTNYSQEFLNQGEIHKSFIYNALKRTIDIMLSLLGLLILSPLLIIIAILIKFEDNKGAILFKQKRVGKNGAIFYMYKFRSMIHNAEDVLETIIHLNEVNGAMFKVKNDPRVTKIGRFIRSTSIDELPQLWNVLKGEMSLVGPRPPLIREVEQYTEFEKQRLLIKPGCTGLWQATSRNEVGFDEMVKLDLKYIRQRSIVYDIKIILLTIKSLVFKRAY